jgi:hypothetical protein
MQRKPEDLRPMNWRPSTFWLGQDGGNIRQVIMRGLERVDQTFVLTMAVYNLVRMRSLAAVRLQIPG